MSPSRFPREIASGSSGPTARASPRCCGFWRAPRIPDDGEIAVRKRLRMSYVEQESEFRPGDTVRSVVDAAMKPSALPESERGTRFAETLGRAGFVDLEAEATRSPAAGRSGSRSCRRWCRAPTSCCSTSPRIISTSPASSGWRKCWSRPAFACVVVSHDRYFLENVATEMAELSRVYPDGMLRVKGRYSEFLEKKEEFLHAQSKRQEALENLVHSRD